MWSIIATSGPASRISAWLNRLISPDAVYGLNLCSTLLAVAEGDPELPEPLLH